MRKVHRYRDRWQHPVVVVNRIIRKIGAVCHRVYTYFVFASFVCPIGVLFFFVFCINPLELTKLIVIRNFLRIVCIVIWDT